MQGYRLIDVQAALVTPGSDTEIEVENVTQAVTLLSTNVVIAAGDEHSDPTGLVLADVKTNDDALVNYPDTLWLNVVDAGGGSRGLEIVLLFI
jgi:pyruvate/2-oxoglutarate dehydrogenase complex dihydrolipoamide dehydrogenase (E3) component